MLLTVFLNLPGDSDITQIIISDSSESEGKQIEVPLYNCVETTESSFVTLVSLRVLPLYSKIQSLRSELKLKLLFKLKV